MNITDMIDNYLNGNLTDAKRAARRFRESTILTELSREYGYTLEASAAIAAYLKGTGPFEDACIAEYRQKHPDGRL